MFSNGSKTALIIKALKKKISQGTHQILKTVIEIRCHRAWRLGGYYCPISLVQLLSHVWFLVTLWMAACQASLSITNSWSLLKLMSIESVIPSNHFILCWTLLFLPSSFSESGSFLRSQFFATGGQSIGVSPSTSVLQWLLRTYFL